MSNEIKKGQLFIKEVLARLTGDGTEALAAKISRKAVSAIEGQLASLNSKKVDLENTLEEAEENLEAAKYPVTIISQNETYISNILTAQRKVNEAKANLEATVEAAKYFEELLASF